MLAAQKGATVTTGIDVKHAFYEIRSKLLATAETTTANDRRARSLEVFCAQPGLIGLEEVRRSGLVYNVRVRGIAARRGARQSPRTWRK